VTVEPQPDLERLSSGSPALDRILGGGFPTRSVTVICGPPGTGKTIFTLQMMFHLAKQGRRGIYFTTLSEPALKLIRYMQLFPFFDVSLLDNRITFVDLGSVMRADGVERALATARERVEHDDPEVVAIDSFRVLHDFLHDPARGRACVHDLAVHLASWGATTLLVGEYQPHELAVYPEFAIADGIVRLTNEAEGLTAVRGLEVVKLRGANYLTGRHFFEIGPGGLTFYPRVTAPGLQPEDATLASDRVPIGVDGLDDLLRGGLPGASATVVQGATGTGKTLLGLHFLLDGARRGEPGVLFTLEETPDQLRGIAGRFGWDLPALEAQGSLILHHISPVELSPDRFLAEARALLERAGTRRAVIDSLSSLALGVQSERRFRELVYALVKHFRSMGVTLLMQMEVTELLGSAQLGGRGVSSTADNVILLRYVEVQGRLDRAIAVLKARGVDHLMELRRAVIGERGLRVGPPFEDLRGVLTGIPVQEVARRARARRGKGRSPR
jgi:circadian clock protein KaiC